MTENTEKSPFEEIIDLRELILALWAQKWVIVITVILTGLAAFLVSKFLIQESYQASAYLTFTNPALRAELETSIQTNPVDLETSGLPELAESQELKKLTFDELSLQENEHHPAIKFSASMQGEAQLKLGVTGEDPSLVAEAANAWARVVSTRYNDLFGKDEKSIEILEQDTSQAKANWAASQLALENYLPESRLNSLGLQLSAARSMMAKYLQETDNNQLLISDAQTLQIQIENTTLADTLSTGTILSLITLQQRAAAFQGDPGLEIQIDPSWKADLTSSEALAILQGFVDALEDQNEELVAEIAALEDDISDLDLSMEKEQYQIDQLTQERDLARKTYTALSSQLEETRITITQEERPARIGSVAVEPNEPSKPSIVLYTLLAAMAGGILAMCGVLIADWWSMND